MPYETFSEYHTNREARDWRQLDEAGLSRVLSHLATRNVGMVTAFRRTFDLAENRSRNRELQAQIRAAGFGFLRLGGYWIEDKGLPTETPVEEESFFVIGSKDDDQGKMLGFLRKMGKKYEQDAIIYKPWNSESANLVFMSNPSQLEPLGPFSMKPQDIEDMYSKFKGYKFVFKSLSEQRSFMSRLAHQKGYQ